MKLHAKHNRKNRRGGLASKAKNPSVPIRKSLGLYKAGCLNGCGTTRAETFERSMGMYCPKSDKGIHRFQA